MRCYRADLVSMSTGLRAFEGFDVLFEKLDRKAMALPHFRNGCNWYDDGEDVETAKPNMAVTIIAVDGETTSQKAEELLHRALELWGVNDAKRIQIQECTLQDCFFINTHRNEFYEHHLTPLIGLDSLQRVIKTSGHAKWIYETLIDGSQGEDAIVEAASQTAHSKALVEEVERTYADAADFEKAGYSAPLPGQLFGIPQGNHVPVHYIVEGGSITEAKESTSILLRALLNTKRIDSNHVYTFNLDEALKWYERDDGDDMRLLLTEQLIQILDGNVVVIRYGELDGSLGFEMSTYSILTKMLELLSEIPNSIQLVFQVPRGKSEVIRRLRLNFDKPLVLIECNKGVSTSAISLDVAYEHLQKMTEDDGYADDGSLKPFLTKRLSVRDEIDLGSIYKEWRQLVESRDEHPAYAKVISQTLSADTFGQKSAVSRLDELIGLKDAKETLHNIIKRTQMNRKLMERGLPIQEFSMNMVFTGSPGTGKTEVARLYAEILKEVGVLREGRLVCRSGAECFNVEKAFKAARGSVLFIDEAYSLYNNSSSMIASLIAHMEDHRNETVVILAGYKGHMNALLDSNPGFRSRIGFTVDFPDYKSSELLQIFDLMCKHGDMTVEDDAHNAVRDAIERGGRRDDQGNARYIRNLYESAVGAQQVRLAEASETEYTPDVLLTLTREDIERAVKYEPKGDIPGRDALDALIGLEEVKKEVAAKLDFALVQKAKRDAKMKAPFIPMHMAFKGAPGTGKTEVARIIGRIMREEGMLSVGDFYEICGHDLVYGFAGSSSAVVNDLFERARGSVVFIDEAYSLLYGGAAGSEAIAAIIAQMENLRDEVVVIFAGYSKEIDELFEANPGFASRVKTHITFPNYKTDELVQIFHKMVKDQGCKLGRGVDDALREIFNIAVKDENFGNGRFVRNLMEEAMVKQSVRIAAEIRKKSAPSKSQLRTLLVSDIKSASSIIVHKSANKSVGFAA